MEHARRSLSQILIPGPYIQKRTINNAYSYFANAFRRMHIAYLEYVIPLWTNVTINMNTCLFMRTLRAVPVP